jgi:hypothetical protein
MKASGSGALEAHYCPLLEPEIDPHTGRAHATKFNQVNFVTRVSQINKSSIVN